MMVKTFLILFCIFFTVHCKLKFVATLHRHGARTPNKFYKTGYWPEGQAQLTEFGKFQLYELGQEYRKRYILNESEAVRDFFPKEINFATKGDFLVLSSPKERAFESFTYLYQGLFGNSSIELQTVKIYDDQDMF